MDYKKLADLLYPEINYNREFWENKYPKRNLESGMEVTRFAPSPTGYLHMGHFYGAMTDFLIAKSTGGVFYFRLEDTDKKREIDGAEIVALRMLEKFGIVPDEGLLASGEEKGIYGPYRQSERKELYLTFAKILVSEGKAFPCFCDAAENKEEIFERRENLLEENSELEEKDICRNLTFEEIEKNILAKKPFALRLKSSGKSGDRIKFVDEVRGERETDANAKDVVLIKSNGIPPYCFAHAIDDHFMRTTVVVRGEEWLSTLPQHLEIFDALGFDRVRYIHTPLICKISDNGNKRKISKRLDPEADMRFYLKEGFTTESVLEYLLNLANSNFEIWRKENPTEPNSKFKFSIEKIGTSSPMFDIVKLCDISKNFISTLSAEEVFEKVLAWADEFDLPFAKELKERKDYSIKVFSIDRYNAKPRKDIAKWSDVQLFLGFMFKCYNKLNCLYDFEIDGFREDIVMQFLKAYLEVFDLDDEKDVWFDKIKSLAGQLGFAVDNKEYKQNPAAFNGNVADACTFVRLALTGRRNSPDIYAIMKVLGKEEIAKRINNLIDLLK